MNKNLNYVQISRLDKLPTRITERSQKDRLMITEEEFLAGLEELELCYNVGTFPNDSNVIQVHSWDEAYERSMDLEWCKFTTDRLNDFWSYKVLGEDSKWQEGAPKGYDEYIEKKRELVFKMVEHKAKRIGCPESYRNEIMTSLRGCLFAALREIRYHNVTHATFFMLPASWIFKGHFPCGYEGEYPDGKLIIY